MLVRLQCIWFNQHHNAEGKRDFIQGHSENAQFMVMKQKLHTKKK